MAKSTWFAHFSGLADSHDRDKGNLWTDQIRRATVSYAKKQQFEGLLISNSFFPKQQSHF